jgi:hypothetical protein
MADGGGSDEDCQHSIVGTFAVASFEPASAEEATFIKKRKALVSKDSTVTTYQATSASN